MSGENQSGSLLRPAFVARHYRGIIVTLVLLNTALIVFLIVYIWEYAPQVREVTTGSEPIAAGVVKADRMILWSAPGGLEHGAESRGVLEQGREVKIIRGQRLDGRLWLEVVAGDRGGWLLEPDIEYNSPSGGP
jgi:hypothetical protein